MRRSTLSRTGETKGISVSYFAGLVNTLSLDGFRRLIYRLSRGRVFVQSVSLGSVFNVSDFFDESIPINKEDPFFQNVKDCYSDWRQVPRPSSLLRRSNSDWEKTRGGGESIRCVFSDPP